MASLSISEMSNVGLVEQADRAVGEEHGNGIRILDFLIELERRSLHLEQGYSSLFDYCTRRWHYSPSKAGRYIATARAMVRWPELRRLLDERQLTICGAARIASALDAGGGDELLRAVAGKTYAEIDRLVATKRVAPRIPDRIRPVGVRAVGATGNAPSGAEGSLFASRAGSEGSVPCSVPGSVQGTAGASASVATSTATDANDGVPSGDSERDPSKAGGAEGIDSQRGSDPTSIGSLEEVQFEIRFLASGEFVAKLERAKAVCSSQMDLESVLGAALDLLLERQDPERREARRAKKGQKRGICSTGQVSIDSCDPVPKGEVPVAEESGPTSQPSSRRESGGSERSAGRAGGPRSRHIPAATRDAVFARDGGSCTYVGRDGVRCGSRSYLQIDHVHPFSLGGGHEPDNLRLLCGRHNRLEAARMLGEGVRSGGGLGSTCRPPGVS